MPELPLVLVGAAVVGAVLFYLLRSKADRPRLVAHEYFDRLWLWPPGSHTRWEAELDLGVPGVEDKLGLYAEATHEELAQEEPTAAEVAFCQRRLSDHDGLFRLARPRIEEIWDDWVDHAMPADWRADLTLVGLSVPLDGSDQGAWEVSYFCDAAAHYFTVEMREGRAASVSVDG